MSTIPRAPEGYRTVNPFVFADDAPALIRFMTDVFGARERMDAHTVDTDGLLLHSELELGDSIVMVVDRKPDWPFTPAFLQVYVDDLATTLERARAAGARVITEPRPFFGDVLSRVLDPWGDIWWVYSHEGGPAEWPADGGEEWAGPDAAGAEWEGDLAYVHDTITAAMRALRDPRG
ncbi:putative glyoxalase superfamily protein PhnB [Diaminobutyricimonas aerilata]|uniref:Putative glyoxalase superfamily protein PhnB n=1 Tax=Diaminobutyricimonas aerilata TaxID=1162967 RepID=A0A2M9CF97_9MICO|nr:VOC family protein [Diaminobutyricimonas aerilata]PJJ70532.1 putative glyoxalase superfamily protein PhnB [Diaminobutyricimonas aerilata]